MSIRFGIMTASDRCASGERDDLSGPALVNAIASSGWHVLRTIILPDDMPKLSKTMAEWADAGDLDVILVTGGTGFAPRDVTPEATLAVIQRQAPGMAEAMRHESLLHTKHAMLSRGVVGIRGSVLIVDLPGNPKAAVENFEVIKSVLCHAVELIKNKPDAERHH